MTLTQIAEPEAAKTMKTVRKFTDDGTGPARRAEATDICRSVNEARQRLEQVTAKRDKTFDPNVRLGLDTAVDLAERWIDNLEQQTYDLGNNPDCKGGECRDAILARATAEKFLERLKDPYKRDAEAAMDALATAYSKAENFVKKYLHELDLDAGSEA